MKRETECALEIVNDGPDDVNLYVVFQGIGSLNVANPARHTQNSGSRLNPVMLCATSIRMRSSSSSTTACR